MTATPSTPPPRRSEVDPATFAALDLRVGRVVRVEPHEGTRRPAYLVWVDFGPAVGTLATSAQVAHYPPEALLGRLVVGAINIGTKRVAGFESQFLLLGAQRPDGQVALLGVDGEVPPGSVVY